MLYEEKREPIHSHFDINPKKEQREGKQTKYLLKNPKLLKEEFFCCYGNTENKG